MAMAMNQNHKFLVWSSPLAIDDAKMAVITNFLTRASRIVETEK